MDRDDINLLLSQAEVIDKLKVMENFVLVSVEIERLSKAYIQLEQVYDKDKKQWKVSEKEYQQKIKVLIQQNEQLNALAFQNNDQYEVQLSQKIDTLLSVNQKLDQQNQKLSEDNKRLQGKLIELNQDYDNQRHLLQQCEDNFKNKIDKQISIIKQIDQQNEDLKKDLKEKSSKLEQVLNLNKELVSELEILNKIQRDGSVKQNSYKKIDKQYEDLRRDYVDKEMKIEQVLKLNKDLVRDIENQNKIIIQMNGQILQMEKYANQKVKEQTNHSELQVFNKRLEAKNQTLLLLEQERDQLQKKCNELQFAINDKEGKIRIFQQQFIDMNAQNQNTQKKIIQLQQSHSDELQQFVQQQKLNQEVTEKVKADFEEEFQKNQKFQEVNRTKDLEISKLKEQVDLYKQDCQEMKKVVLEINQAFSIQKDMFQRSQMEHASLKESMLSAPDQSDYIYKLQRADQVNQELSEQLNWVQNELNYFKNQCYNLQTQCEDLIQTKNYLSSLLMERRY
ncbi:hypothetical protein pb186bvf_011218 [Paramecium bursaria]